MTFAITDDGMTTQTYDEIVAELVAAYEAAYGADINTDPESPDGQRIGIEAKHRMDIQSAVLQIFNGMDPELATGTAFNSLLKLVGTSLLVPTRSTVDVTVTTDRDLTLPAGWTVEDDTGQGWALDDPTATLTGANAVTLHAAAFGAVEAGINTVTTQTTIVLGVLSVTNAAEATIGVAEESIGAARVRRKQLLTLPATSSLGGLFSAVAGVAGVTDVVAYENDMSTHDATRDMVPHSIWAVVEGGAVDDIVEALAIAKNAGTAKKGAVSGTYVEERTRPDGSTLLLSHIVQFDRPTLTPLYINITVESRDGSGIDTASIKAALASRAYRIAENALASELYALAYSAADNFIATLLEVSSDGITYTGGREVSDYDERFTLDAADIVVTVI